MSADYTELAINVSMQTGITELPLHFGRLCAMAERDIFKRLRVGSMLTTITFDTSAGGEIALPDDCVEVESVRCTALDPELDRVAVNDLRSKQRLGFAVAGNKLLVYPDRDSVQLEYYAKPSGLEAASTNWLLDLEPEIYLHACAFQAYVWKSETEKAAASKEYYISLIEEMADEDNSQRYKNQKMKLDRNTP